MIQAHPYTNFINITTEKRSVPIGAWAGQPGIDGRNNLIAVFRAMKTAILQSEGLGSIITEDELDQLIDAMEKEWDETEGAEMEIYIVYAQRPIN